MRAPFCHLFLFALSAWAQASASDIGIASQNQDYTDDLDEWLAATERMSPEALKPCPIFCSAAGNSSSTDGWFLFPDFTKLALCNETMLLSMAVQAEAEENSPKASLGQPVVRACLADYESKLKSAFVPEDGKASLCTTANRVLEEASVYMHHPQLEDDDGFSVSHAVAAGHQIVNRLAQQEPSCTNNAMEFGYFQSSAIGIFAGAEVHQHGVSSVILRKLLEYAQEQSVSRTTVVQLCGADGRGADYSIGVVATSSRNLLFVQEVVRTWASGGCISQADAGEDWIKVTLRIPAPADTIPSSSSLLTNGTQGSSNLTTRDIQAHTNARSHAYAHAHLHAHVVGVRSGTHLSVRADCKTATVQTGDGCWAVANRCGITQANLEKYNRANLCSTLVKDEKVCCSSGTLPSTLPAGNSDGTCKTKSVVSGDDCGSLASKCGISAADFMTANPKTNLCSTLAVGQPVCCTKGTMPDLKPKPDANGNCAVYQTKQDDSCYAIAASRGLTLTELESFNKKTWGWNGCNLLYPGFNMCVSSGSPPMPASVSNAVCGPTVPGTLQPTAGTNLSTLNPCPLNVCCNVWGQCGLTDDFCVISKSETGAPGTSAPGKNGCISNCGRDIIKGPAPAEKIKVAYFESWNLGRDCLNMWVDQIDTSQYTHVHFAFANITRGDYKPEITEPWALRQFQYFKQMTGVKKIISFGGWDFSTAPGSYSILREAVLPANREKFKNNLIAFMNEHNLDGIDLDWEYPGAPDIPDIPSDDPVNGLNYYRLLSSLKSAVGPSKSVSFAAPASYWYLRAFPIKNMARDLDYIIYMAYDLHGQWDYGNKWTSSGCPTGNCLRSHVNETETLDALSMITKAGAPSNKVVVGVASYGRSFKMAEKDCSMENCLFTGSSRHSDAAEGRCTRTAGYISNAEINEIIATGNVRKLWALEGTNFLVYNDTEWVAFMDDDMKAMRARVYDSYNFAGTTDWAVDLQRFRDGSNLGDDDDYDDHDDDDSFKLDDLYADEEAYEKCSSDAYTEGTLDFLEDSKARVPSHCLARYLVQVELATYRRALEKYKELIDNGYDKKFKTYKDYVIEQISSQINSYMATDKADKYFKCKETYTERTCCPPTSCTWCSIGPAGCNNTPGCTKGEHTVTMDKCPKYATSKEYFDTTPVPNATFTLTDREGFFTDIAKEYGIDESWIVFGKRLIGSVNGCQYGNGSKASLERCNKYFYNFPVRADPGKIEVFNPKDLIGDSFPKATDMLQRFETMQIIGEYDELLDWDDLVDAMSVPAFLAEEALTNMESVIETAEKVEEMKRKAFILNFLGGLLFWIPFVGQVLGPGMRTLGLILRMIGRVGEAAMGIYDVVNDPGNALGIILSSLIGAELGRGGYKTAASARRGMSPKEYNNLGNVKTKLDRVENIRGGFCSF